MAGKTLRRNPIPSRVFETKMRILSAGLALVAVLAGTAIGADVGGARSVVLGKTTNYPSSGCPIPSRCEVVARVTGVQMRADAFPHPFRVTQDGQVVAWWLKLPRLRSTQVKSFSSLFGGPPSARLSILRRGKRGRVRLIRQGPVENLRQDLDGKGRARFKLPEALRVKAGDYVGLTAVTWAPAFAVDLDADNDVWLASRPESRCSTPSSRDPQRFAAYYRRTDAHIEPSTVKHYRCVYRTARLLYWARVVPDPAPAPAPGGGTGTDPGIGTGRTAPG
jgi:hypothetical protein